MIHISYHLAHNDDLNHNTVILVKVCFKIYRGSEDSGELLAAFELFELGDSGRWRSNLFFGLKIFAGTRILFE